MTTTGWRDADREARRLLPGKGVTKQAFAIFPKIAEVNDLLTPQDQDRIVDVHPDVSFMMLKGDRLPVRSRKIRLAGFTERFTLLTVQGELTGVPDRRIGVRQVGPGLKVDADDTLDACVAAWTAMRFYHGLAQRVPTAPQFGVRDLRAEIVY